MLGRNIRRCLCYTTTSPSPSAQRGGRVGQSGKAWSSSAPTAAEGEGAKAECEQTTAALMSNGNETTWKRGELQLWSVWGDWAA